MFGFKRDYGEIEIDYKFKLQTLLPLTRMKNRLYHIQHYCTDERKGARMSVPICLSKLLEPAKMAGGRSKQVGKTNWD